MHNNRKMDWPSFPALNTTYRKVILLVQHTLHTYNRKMHCQSELRKTLSVQKQGVSGRHTICTRRISATEYTRQLKGASSNHKANTENRNKITIDIQPTGDLSYRDNGSFQEGDRKKPSRTFCSLGYMWGCRERYLWLWGIPDVLTHSLYCPILTR